MKIETQSQQNIETKEAGIQLNKEDKDILSQVNLPFSELIAQQLNTDNIISSDIDYNYDSISMDIQDGLFFIDLAQNCQISAVQNNMGQIQSIVETQIAQNEISTKTLEVTNKLTELIEKAQNTQKPVRISFDNDVSVILKIDKNGKVTAEFIPGSIEVENYLRNNIASLRQKFDEQNLPYNNLSYRQNERQNRKNKNKGE